MFKIQSLLICAIVPFIWGGSSVIAAQPIPKSAQLIAQSKGGNFWGQRPRKRLGSRGGSCAVAPGLLAEEKTPTATQNKLSIWHDRPMLVWAGKATLVKVRDHENRSVVLWTQKVTPEQRYVVYGGEALQPGKYYQWQVLGEVASPSDQNYWTTFEIMPTEQHNQIKTELQQLEQQWQRRGADTEEIAQQKAAYFRDRNLWSDALQVVFEVEHPSAAFVEQRRSYVAQLCPELPVETTQTKSALHKTRMKIEPPRRQERQELSFLIYR